MKKQQEYINVITKRWTGREQRAKGGSGSSQPPPVWNSPRSYPRE